MDTWAFVATALSYARNDEVQTFWGEITAEPCSPGDPWNRVDRTHLFAWPRCRLEAFVAAIQHNNDYGNREYRPRVHRICEFRPLRPPGEGRARHGPDGGGLMGEAVGVRLPEDLLEKIEQLSRVQGEDRSTTMRKLIQRGFEEVARERAAQGYKEGRMTLSEAAERAGLTVWEMEQYLVHHGYRSSYSIQDLAKELETLNP